MLSQGIYEMSAAEYHADPAPAPSLSASVASVLLRQSPMHAAAIHPRFGNAPRQESETFDLGTAAHAFILEGMEACVVVEAHDWRTNKAKEERDAARAAGLTPILVGKLENVRAMATAIRKQLSRFSEPPIPLMNGKPEQTVIWEEETPHGRIWCRARPDFLHDDGRTIDDLKTTARSAEPNAYIRAMYSSGGDLQPAFYLRGLKAVTGNEGRFRFVVGENAHPFATSVIGLDPAALAHADDKAQQAINRWAECIKNNQFPGYSRRVHYAEVPAWETAGWMEREEEVMA